MAQYDLGKVVGEDGQQGAKGDTGNGIASISKTGSSGLVDTYTITFTDGNTTTFTVTNGSNASVDIVTQWEQTLSDSKVASEKLVKDSLDGKLGTSIGSNANRILTTTTGGVITTSSTLNDTKINAYHSNYVYLDNTVLTQEDFNIDVDSALKSISDSIGTAIQYIQQ